MAINIESLLIKAEEFFADSDFESALELYGEALSHEPMQREARVGVLLCDIALDHEDEAQALYDYYKVIKKEGTEDAESRLEELMKSFDGSMEKISQFMYETAQEKLNGIDGIQYQEFKDLERERGGFKRAFEDLMFSTKIVISGKEDFLEFMDKLVDHGYEEIALSYLEHAGETFTHDERIRKIFEKINHPH